MKFGWIKKFPKFVFVAGILIVSTGLFFLWWKNRSAAHGGAVEKSVAQSTNIETAKRLAVDFEAGVGRYFMAGDDLYDAVAGQLVAKNFLNGANPDRLLYEPETKKLIGVFPKGFARFALDGSKEAELVLKYKGACVPDTKKIVYAKDGDIWTADVDLKAFKFLNERKATSLGQFDEANFSDNLIMLTEKFALLRNHNQVVRVDLESGQVKPMQADLLHFQKRRSPDSKTIIGIRQNEFYRYDFEADRSDTHPMGRSKLTDAQWLDNDRCVVLVNGTTVGLYDRVRDKLGEICSLGSGASQIAEPSPGSRYVFLISAYEVAVIDVENKSIIPLSRDVQGYYWLGPDSLIFSRETQDTERRGTWFKQLGGTETRITDEPYLVVNGISQVLPLKEAGLVVFQGKTSLHKIKLDGSGLENFTSSPVSASRLFNIERPAN